MNMDMLHQPYASERHPVFASRGMVCTTQPLAAQAGLDMLKRGGNAIDAAIATAIAMTVLEPVSNGIGGDNFALVWCHGTLYGLNASGCAPALFDADAVRAAGHTTMPGRGWFPVTVPGAPAGWVALHRRFGKLPFASLFEPAISYAEKGYPLQPTASTQWAGAYRRYAETLTDPMFAAWFSTFAPKGRAPHAGEMVILPDHARTLRELAETSCDSFYRGAIAAKIDRFARETGGWLRADDLAAFQPEWVTPISTHYKGVDVWEIPPNGHGIVALMALNILRNDKFDCRDADATFHRQIEALKLAYADGRAYVAEPSAMPYTSAALLDPAYGAARRRLIGETAADPKPGVPDRGGTIYLCTADGEGNMVSLIQSNYQGFGSGLVVPHTGIALHDRGANFSLEPGHPNCGAPRKRPYHTIIPGFLTREGKALGPFGVMGGFMQPQGHMQVVMNMVDFGLNPQAALDAPRWQWIGGTRVALEPSFSNPIAQQLARRGHQIQVELTGGDFGRGQIILRTSDGTLCGGTEPRADGFVAAW